MAALARPLSSPPPATPLDAVLSDVTSRGLGVLLHALLAAEADDYVARYSGLRDEIGRALVARNGVARSRVVPLGPVTVWVSAPRVNDRRVVEGERQKYTSALLPPNKAPCIGNGFRLAAAYLLGLATGDLTQLFAQLAPAASRFVTGEVREALASERETILGSHLGDVRFDRVVMAEAMIDTDACTALYGVRPSGGVELVALAFGAAEHPGVAAKIMREAEARGVDTQSLGQVGA